MINEIKMYGWVVKRREDKLNSENK